MKGFIEIHCDGTTILINVSHIVSVEGSEIFTDESTPSFATDFISYPCEETYEEIVDKIYRATAGR